MRTHRWPYGPCLHLSLTYLIVSQNGDTTGHSSLLSNSNKEGRGGRDRRIGQEVLKRKEMKERAGDERRGKKKVETKARANHSLGVPLGA